MTQIQELIDHIKAEHPEAGNVDKGLHCEPDPLNYLRRVDDVFHGRADHRWHGDHIRVMP